jgi:murein DD-endopeptidase MepM/ murein hydrolase activator NlpD
MKNSILFSLAVLVLGCNGISPLNRLAPKSFPYESYVKSLETAKLDRTAMARQWVRAGEKALNDSIILKLPFSESGYFLASQPAARSYRFDARRGQVLTVNGQRVTTNDSRLFLDLFVWKGSEWTPAAHGDSIVNITYEFDSDVSCIVRLQPELLATTDYSISISLTPVLMNPVAGATNKSIKSFYGDSRDGGKRRHEGVDIFAKKGTPVVAPTSGVITRVGTGNLGGNVVWLRDQKRGHSYYFAHLDKQLVTPGASIKKGDTLGTVGNTGNARFTPPHLHFGIYQHRSFDPVHFIQTLDAVAEATPWDTTVREFDYKVTAKKISLRSGPGNHHEGIAELSKETYLQVIAQSDTWYRVQLPDDRQGFVLKSKVAPIKNGKPLPIKDAVTVFSKAHHDAVPLQKLEATGTVEVLANFEKFKFVRTQEGVVGWLII